MAPKKLITQTQFAKMAGVTQHNISQQISNGAKLSQAAVGNKIDIDHPIAIEYLNRNNPPPPPPSLNKPPDFNDGTGLPPTDFLAGTEIENLGDFTLRELATKFGTAPQLIDWLNARKKIVDISEKEIKNAKLRGDVIPRDFVLQFIVNAIERTHMNLLIDATKAISSDVRTLCLSGATIEEIEIKVEDVLSSHLTSGVEQIKQAMRASKK